MSTFDETLPEVGQSVEAARGTSLLRAAEQRRVEREQHLFLPVPSWGGELIAEYGIIDKQELVKMSQKMMRRIRQNPNMDRLMADIELISRACVGLHILDPESGDRVAVEDEFGHVGYDRIATILGVDNILTSQAEAIRYVMGQRNKDDTWNENATAVAMHARALSRWLRDPSERGIDIEELLGE